MTSDPTKITLLEEWMQGKEGEHCEFKEWKPEGDFEKMARYCSALANEGGGRFIMGVSDLRPRKVVGIPMKHDGRYWMRKEDSLVEMSEERLREIFAESGHDFSADECPGLTVADLDLSALEDFRRRWIAKARKAEDLSLAERLATPWDASWRNCAKCFRPCLRHS